jgi:hypothetical protein
MLKRPSKEERFQLQYTFRPQNASNKGSSRISDNLHCRQRPQANQPVNDSVILPERDTNPEWETLLLKRLPTDQTAVESLEGPNLLEPIDMKNLQFRPLAEMGT